MRWVENENGCWLWLGPVLNSGYGQWQHTRSGPYTAHATMYVRENGPIPDGMEVSHTCHVRLCVNPDHLVAETSSENKMRSRPDTCPYGHQYDAVEVNRGREVRRCTTCRRRTQAASAKRRKAEETAEQAEARRARQREYTARYRARKKSHVTS